MGRKSQGLEVNFNIRMRADVVERLEAAARENERDRSEEIRQRIDESFELEEPESGYERDLTTLLRSCLRSILSGARLPDGKPVTDWRKDPDAYLAAVRAFDILAARFIPSGKRRLPDSEVGEWGQRIAELVEWTVFRSVPPDFGDRKTPQQRLTDWARVARANERLVKELRRDELQKEELRALGRRQRARGRK